MNRHQNKAFSCLIGALNSPQKVNGYGADYALKKYVMLLIIVLKLYQSITDLTNVLLLVILVCCLLQHII